MGRAVLRENTILALLSGPSGTINLLIPLYLTHLGYHVALVGVILALASVATLVSRIPAARMYRPERSRRLLISTLLVSGLTFAILPEVSNVVLFSLTLALNRVFIGLAVTFFLARYLDLLGHSEGRRRAMGYYGGIQAAGYTSANLLIGLVADFLGFHAAFLYGTVFCVLAAGLLMWAPELQAQKVEGRDPGQASHRRTGLLGGVNDPGLWSVLNVMLWNNSFHVILTGFFPVYAAAVGMSATQVGLTRAMYSGINAVGRPIAGIALERLSLRQATYTGLGLQTIVLFSMPFLSDLSAILVAFLAAGTGRSVVVVANSIGLVEEVDDSRVSRGVATSAYNAAADVSHITAPLAAGGLAAALGTGAMFSIVAACALTFFALGDGAVRGWRRRLRPPPPVASVR